MKANNEIEIKIKLADKEKVKQKLLSFGWKMKNVVFQQEYRITDVGNSLGEKGIFPRVRKEGEKSVFTIKVKPDGKVNENDKNVRYFKRLEYDIEVEDAKKMAEILSIIGLTEQRILEKYREIWINEEEKELSIVIDSLKFGDYMELEGSEDKIDRMVEKLELANEERITLAYWRVYRKYCEQNNLKEETNLLLKETK
jgi:adenylate cyclase class IV